MDLGQETSGRRVHASDQLTRVLAGAKPVVQRVVTSTVGVMHARDLVVRARHIPSAPRLARAEAREVQRARKLLPRIPEAQVVTVMPTYGRSALVVDAVDSALAQTVTDHVVVVVVDGGEPPPLQAHARLHVVALAEHHGIPGLVRNVAIRTSASPFLAFLDDDNTWEPNHLEVSLAAHRAGAELTYTGMRQVRLDGTEAGIRMFPYARRTLRNRSYIDTSTMVVRRSKAVRFSRAPRGGSGVYEDWTLAYRLSRRLRTELVPEVTVHYLLHPDGHMQRHL
jgi:glycosyltransferase involved in cell wall biosynthesis